MLDRAKFLRPIAHRGLHDRARGIIENTAPAFAAALAKGYGIECDLRPIAGGFPVVFHDDTMERLLDAEGPIADLLPSDLAWVHYKGQPDNRILSFAGLLEMVAGRVPLLVELKSEWEPPNLSFVKQVTDLAGAYKGPIALMSFDTALMAAVRQAAPGIARGIVSGSYAGEGWWDDKLDKTRRYRLANLMDSEAVEPDFYAYEVAALPTRMTSFAREVQALPLFTWTVRTQKDREHAAAHADAMIFEGFEP